MTYGIFPPAMAEMTKARAGQKYRPSNGTEGGIFITSWCCKCQRDKAMREGKDTDECDDSELCYIIDKTFAYDVEDHEYPVEWQYDKDGQPICTAFVPAGEPIPEPRCAHTQDLF